MVKEEMLDFTLAGGVDLLNGSAENNGSIKVNVSKASAEK